MEQYLNVGKIVNTHGIRGEVKVISITDFSEQRYAVGNKLHLFLPGSSHPLELTVKSHRKHKNFDLLTFENYSNINDVEAWKNGILKVAGEELEKLPEGEYYFHQIIGCEVYTIDGAALGKVEEILTPGANDVWVVKGPNNREYLIPYIENVVSDIQIDKNKIIITPIEGLLE